MKLYRISQEVNTGYDTYSDAIVCAENEEEARKTHPSEYTTHWRDGKWYGTYKTTNPETNGKEYETEDSFGTWVAGNNLETIKVEYIGEASSDLEKGIVCASFHAG